jgi:hypothetical protein
VTGQSPRKRYRAPTRSAHPPALAPPLPRRRSLLVVPAPHVFGDASGEVAALEAAAKEQAATAAGEGGAGAGAQEDGQDARLELLKLLHVGPWGGRRWPRGRQRTRRRRAARGRQRFDPGGRAPLASWRSFAPPPYLNPRLRPPPARPPRPEPPPKQARAADLKAELRALLLRQGVRSMRVVPVKRNYAFEEEGIPHGEQWVLKVRGPRRGHRARLACTVLRCNTSRHIAWHCIAWRGIASRFPASLGTGVSPG